MYLIYSELAVLFFVIEGKFSFIFVWASTNSTWKLSLYIMQAKVEEFITTVAGCGANVIVSDTDLGGQALLCCNIHKYVT